MLRGLRAYHKAKSKANSPNTTLDVLVETSKNNEGHDTGSHKALGMGQFSEVELSPNSIRTRTMSTAKSVVDATRNPLFFRRLAVSSAASVALVAQTGYSPPAPKPAMPRATIIIQNILNIESVFPGYNSFGGSEPHPNSEVPCAAADNMIPSTKNDVVATTPVLLPTRSIRAPKNSMPKISPMRKEFDNLVLMLEDMVFLYLNVQ